MDPRNPFLKIAVGTQGTGKSSLMLEYLYVNDRNLIVPANRSDAGVTWPRIAEVAVKGTYEDDPLDPNGRQIHVIYAPEMDTFTGNRCLFIEGDNRRLTAITHPRLGFQNGGLFMDDFRKYVPHKGDLPPHLTNMISDRRHYNLDIMLALHTFNDINIQLLGWDPELHIFRTTLPPNDTVRDKVRNFDEMLDVIDRVNRKAKTEPHYHEKFTPSRYDGN